MQFDQLKRREFISLLGGVAAAWPRAARAQQAGKLPTIGFIGGAPSTHGQWFATLVQRLRQLGWIEGRTIAIEYRWTEGRTDRAAEIAAEFVQLKVDVMVTVATDAVLAAKQVTSVIPNVFFVSDAVGNGIVTSLSRPGGNMTGLSVQQVELAGKRVELLRKSFPVFAGWRSWPMSETPPLWLRWVTLGLQPARLALKRPNLKLGGPRISRPRSRYSRAAGKHFMSSAIRS